MYSNSAFNAAECKANWWRVCRICFAIKKDAHTSMLHTNITSDNYRKNVERLGESGSGIYRSGKNHRKRRRNGKELLPSQKEGLGSVVKQRPG